MDMKKCKSTGGIKSVYITDAIPTTVKLTETEYEPKKRYDLDFKNIDESKFKSDSSQTIEFKIFSPAIQKMINWLEFEIKSSERSAEEYYQEINDLESAQREEAKAAAFESVLKYIKEVL